jgi:hypothetical protein
MGSCGPTLFGPFGLEKPLFGGFWHGPIGPWTGDGL